MGRDSTGTTAGHARSGAGHARAERSAGWVRDGLVVAATDVRRRLRRMRARPRSTALRALFYVGVWAWVIEPWRPRGGAAGPGVPPGTAGELDLLAALRGGVAILWIGLAGLEAANATTSLEEVDAAAAVVPAAGVRATLLGEQLATNARRAAFLGVVALFGVASLAAGTGAPGLFGLGLVALVGLTATARLAGETAGLAYAALGRQRRAGRYRPLVAVGLLLLGAVAVLRWFEPLARLVGWLPPAWYADLLLLGTPGVEPSPARAAAAVAGTALALPALFLAAERLAERVWFDPPAATARRDERTDGRRLGGTVTAPGGTAAAPEDAATAPDDAATTPGATVTVLDDAATVSDSAVASDGAAVASADAATADVAKTDAATVDAWSTGLPRSVRLLRRLYGLVPASAPARAVAWRATVRALRQPSSLVMMGVPVFLGATLVLTADEPGPWLPVVLAFYGAWAAGAGVTLNPLASEGPGLPALLAAPVAGRQVVAGYVLTGAALSTPLVVAVPAAAGAYVGVGPGVVAAAVVYGLVLAAVAGAVAVGVGFVLPSLGALSPTAVDGPAAPQRLAFVAYSVCVALVAVPGGAGLLAADAVGGPARLVAVGGLAGTVLLGGAVGGPAGLYAARRLDGYELSG